MAQIEQDERELLRKESENKFEDFLDAINAPYVYIAQKQEEQSPNMPSNNRFHLFQNRKFKTS